MVTIFKDGYTMARRKSTPDGNFDQNLKELATIVKNIEQGELSLEDAMEQFEQGINLAKKCQKILESAELKVQKLTEDSQLQEFAIEEDDD